MDKRRVSVIEKRKRNIYMCLVFLMTAVLCGWWLWAAYKQKELGEVLYEQLRERVSAMGVSETPFLAGYKGGGTESGNENASASLDEGLSEKPVAYCEPLYDFAGLRETNSDIYAWLCVPGTTVDYPVLQSETDNYYLDRNVDLSEGYPGCIYSNACNRRDFSDYVTILYGHNMTRERMFGILHRFEEEEFFEENRQILVYTETGRLTYEILAAVVYSDIYIPAYYEPARADSRQAFWESVKACGEEESSHVLEEVQLEADDRLLVLSTCIRKVEDQRYLVVGRLTGEAVYSTGGTSESALTTRQRFSVSRSRPSGT